MQTKLSSHRVPLLIIAVVLILCGTSLASQLAFASWQQLSHSNKVGALSLYGNHEHFQRHVVSSGEKVNLQYRLSLSAAEQAELQLAIMASGPMLENDVLTITAIGCSTDFDALNVCSEGEHSIIPTSSLKSHLTDQLLNHEDHDHLPSQLSHQVWSKDEVWQLPLLVNNQDRFLQVTVEVADNYQADVNGESADIGFGFLASGQTETVAPRQPSTPPSSAPGTGIASPPPSMISDPPASKLPETGVQLAAILLTATGFLLIGICLRKKV